MRNLPFVLTPAFGRTYKSKKALVEDLRAQRDFVANGYDGGGYINLEQMLDAYGSEWTVQCRYGNGLVKVCVLSAKELSHA